LAQVYKVRISDGSEIPLDLEALTDWYRKGLVKPNDLVLRPGGKRWVPVKQVVPRRKVATPAASPAGASAALRAAVREASPGPRAAARKKQAAAGHSVETQPWRTIVGGALLLGAAAG